MPKAKLTAKLLGETVCPTDKRTINLIDTETHGLMAEIRANGTGTFYLRYNDPRGKRRHYRIGRTTALSVADARRAAQKLNGKVAMGIDPQEEKAEHRATPRVETFVRQSFLPYLASYQRGQSTDWSLLKNHVLPAIGHLYMDEVRRQHLVDMSTHLQLDHKPSSTNRVMVLVRHLFNRAIDWEVPGVARNPSSGIPMLANENQPQRFLTMDEAKRLMKAVEQSESPMLKYIVTLLLLTGARRGEVLNARWEDFDCRSRQWLIPKSKSGRPRYVPLSDPAIRLLESMPRFEGCAYAFPNPTTLKPYSQIFKAWDTARRRAGMPDLRMHDLRHSFASFLVNSGHSLYEVQHLLGHAQPTTTQRYAHLSDETLHTATSSVGSSMEQALNQRAIEVA